MNSENFHDYLKNPSKLHQVSYQELKSLVLQYPFSPNLRYLLMVKSMFDQNKDYDRNLTLSAVSSPDRKKLWKLVTQNKQLKEARENYELSEEFLELKDLSTLEEIIEMQPPVMESLTTPREMGLGEAPPAIENMPALEEEEITNFLKEDEDLGFLEELLGEPTDVEGGTPVEEVEQAKGEPGEDFSVDSQVAVVAVAEISSLEELLDNLTNIEDTNEGSTEKQDAHLIAIEDFSAENSLETGKVENDQTEKLQPNEAPSTPSAEVPLPETATPPAEPAPAPLPKNAFRSWKSGVQTGRASLLAGGMKNLVVKKQYELDDEPEDDFEDDYPEEEAKHFAAQSVKEDTEIATETLALILEQQQHFAKAIAMYERLALQFPEKSSFFAAKIQNLKNKL